MARPPLGATDTERLHLKITAAEISAIDDWRFANRASSRSKAVRSLIRYGIEANASAGLLAEAIAIIQDLKTAEGDEAWTDAITARVAALLSKAGADAK